jgi:putative cardiolipin synthase
VKALKRFAVTACLLVVTGCAGLQPVDLPDEYTPAPTDTPFWHEVEANTPHDWHVLLNEGPDALDWRLRAIDSAGEQIDLQTFLWFFDDSGSMILDHLLAAADRGVQVRMLIDDTFLAAEDEMLLALAEHPGIQYRVYNPFKRRAGGIATRQLLNLAEFGRLDHRMHNKAMVVDNHVAIVGGRNLADEYFGLHGDANFRDLELLLGGPVVQEVSAAFDAYWNDDWAIPIQMLSHAAASPAQLAHARAVSANSTHLHEELSRGELTARWRELIDGADQGDAALFVDAPPKDNPAATAEAPVQVAGELESLFDGAQREIVIVSAYLIPTPHLEGAVERAVRRGVRVRILTNSIGSNNHLTAHSAYRNHIGTLLGHGVELYEVRTDADNRQLYMLTPVERKALALHAKALIIDQDKVFIGSANLDPRSLRINTEMGFLVTSEAFNSRVRSAVDVDFSGDNAWRLELQEDGSVHWVANEVRLTAQPALSTMQRIEDWFFSLLPLEDEL